MKGHNPRPGPVSRKPSSDGLEPFDWDKVAENYGYCPPPG